MNSRQIHLLALALLGSLALAACGKLPDPPQLRTDVSPIDSCELLTSDDADPGGGYGLVPVKTPIEKPVGTEVAKCSYGTSKPPIDVISLEVRRFPSVKKARSRHDSSVDVIARLAGGDGKVIPGLGDHAFWAGGKLNQLHVLVAEFRLIITIEVGPEAGRAAHAEAIAKAAVARLLEDQRPGTPAPRS